ncbi:sulfatase family protein [Thaumasiovibrio subtropicus]|uniref:sulfatase family protein n=1 Tax=Thaumasiovibrio subtropicus TaxID=1891207 RepID=UPI000B359927|nr:sulfatase [Thaumasiovibrio subtropicus]
MNNKSQRPNLLYVFPDQFRLASLGLWQQSDFESYHQGQSDPVFTPHLNRFAEQATILTRAVSNCPVCSPHRGSLMTANFPNKSGVPLNCHSERVCSDLPADEHCFTDVLSEQGYHIGYIGKWHLDLPTKNDPVKPGEFVDHRRPAWDSYTEPSRRHGIDYWYGYGTFDVHNAPHYYDAQGRRHEPQQWSAEHEADKAIAYIENNHDERDADKPFALFVSMNPPHSPYWSEADCRKEDVAKYAHLDDDALLVRDNADRQLAKAEAARYYFANVSGVDTEFGRIVEALKASGEWDNTLVVFTSDHGETLCSQGIEDAKNVIFHEAYAVPFLCKLPNQHTHAINATPLNSADIMPTVLGALGLSDAMPRGRHGRDVQLADPLSMQTTPEGTLYLRNLDGELNQQGQVIGYFAQSRGIRTAQHTLAIEIDQHGELQEILFFDDSLDPYQQRNLPFDPTHAPEAHLLLLLAKELERIDDPWHQLQILPQLFPDIR